MVTFIFSAGLKPEGTVQSCCVILGSITQSKYYIGALREAYLPNLQVFFLLGPSFIPAGLALRKLPFSPTKLDTPLSQLSLFWLWQAALFVSVMYYTKGSPSGGGFNARSCYFSTL